jgi:hypothetical protein
MIPNMRCSCLPSPLPSPSSGSITVPQSHNRYGLRLDTGTNLVPYTGIRPSGPDKSIHAVTAALQKLVAEDALAESLVKDVLIHEPAATELFKQVKMYESM